MQPIAREICGRQDLSLKTIPLFPEEATIFLFKATADADFKWRQENQINRNLVHE
jgi:hypothetical protein